MADATNNRNRRFSTSSSECVCFQMTSIRAHGKKIHRIRLLLWHRNHTRREKFYKKRKEEKKKRKEMTRGESLSFAINDDFILEWMFLQRSTRSACESKDLRCLLRRLETRRFSLLVDVETYAWDMEKYSGVTRVRKREVRRPGGRMSPTDTRLDVCFHIQWFIRCIELMMMIDGRCCFSLRQLQRRRSSGRFMISRRQMKDVVLAGQMNESIGFVQMMICICRRYRFLLVNTQQPTRRLRHREVI